MTGKLLCCGLIAMAVLFCGCAGETDTIDSNANEVKSEVKTVKVDPEVKTAKSEKTMVKLQTNMGDIVIELNEEAAPLAVKNFLTYVEDGFYDGTIFHRVIRDFMIQAGGFPPQMTRPRTNPPIVNEASNGVKNDRGTIAMGQTPGNPDSATSHFFINHKNNDFLNFGGRSGGYAVFGKVVNGMDIVDRIAMVRTNKGNDAPFEQIVITSAKVVTK